jgi:hypothetical protein
VRSSLVERFPDKKEAHGPIPCAPTKMSEESKKIVPPNPGEDITDYSLRRAMEKEPNTDPETIIRRFVDGAGDDQLMLLRITKAIDKFRKSLKPKK